MVFFQHRLSSGQLIKMDGFCGIIVYFRFGTGACLQVNIIPFSALMKRCLVRFISSVIGGIM